MDPRNGIDREFDVRTGVAEDWIELYHSLLFKSESVLRNVSPGLGSDGAGGAKESNRSRREAIASFSRILEGPRGWDVQEAGGGNRTRDCSRNPHPFKLFLDPSSSVESLALKKNLLGRRTDGMWRRVAVQRRGGILGME